MKFFAYFMALAFTFVFLLEQFRPGLSTKTLWSEKPVSFIIFRGSRRVTNTLTLSLRSYRVEFNRYSVSFVIKERETYVEYLQSTGDVFEYHVRSFGVDRQRRPEFR